MQAHQAALAQAPFAAFTVCMTLAMRNGENYRQAVADWLKPVRAVVKPVSEGLFAGALDISKIPSFSDRPLYHFFSSSNTLLRRAAIHWRFSPNSI